jgi:hypothetical protein
LGIHPAGPEKECEDLLHNYISWLKNRWNIQHVALENQPFHIVFREPKLRPALSLHHS